MNRNNFPAESWDGLQQGRGTNDFSTHQLFCKKTVLSLPRVTDAMKYFGVKIITIT
jgi:hypothetical protein